MTIEKKDNSVSLRMGLKTYRPIDIPGKKGFSSYRKQEISKYEYRQLILGERTLNVVEVTFRDGNSFTVSEKLFSDTFLK